MGEILHNFTGRKLVSTDIYKNYDQLVREATRKFKKTSKDLFGIDLKKIDEDDLKDQTVSNGSVVEGVIVLKGTFRKSRRMYSYYMGFNVKGGVLGKPLDVIYTQDLEQLPLKKSSASKLLRKADCDEIVNMDGKAIQHLGVFAGIKKFFKRGQVAPTAPGDTTRKDLKYTDIKKYPQETLNRTKELPGPEGAKRPLTRVPEEQMDPVVRAKLKEAITALDALQKKWEPVSTQMEQLKRDATTYEKEFGDKMLEIYNLSQKFDVIYDIVDDLGTFMNVGIYTTEEKAVAPKLELTATELIKKLEEIPWINEKIIEVKAAATMAMKVMIPPKTDPKLIPEVKIADKERAVEKKEKTAQEKDSTANRVLDMLKDSVQSLVDAVQNFWSGLKSVKDVSVQQNNVPESAVGRPTGTELLTAVMREEIPRPDDSGAGMLKWRRQSSSKKYLEGKKSSGRAERTYEAWDKSYIDTEKVKKDLS
jgi:hypothetical protein